MFMKRILLIMFILLSILGKGLAQVETHYYQNGEITHNPWQSTHRSMDVKRMPSFDLAQLQREDAENDDSGGLFRFGKGFDVSYSLADGQWENVENGRLWTMSFFSEGALSLNFVFNDFHLPEGAELYIENKDKTVLYGPVTTEALTENGYFLTDIILGSQATIFLFEPSWCEGESSLTIKRVVHGYRDSDLQFSNGRPYVPRYYVTCYPDYEMEADGIGLILNSSGTALGNGALMMTTDYSFKPYFLTVYDFVDANEDGVISDTELSSAQNSAFKFRYKYTTCQGSNTTVSYTYNHATFRSAWNTTKFTLFEITGNLKNNPNLTWLGWDRSGEQPTSATCVFYPSSAPEAIIFDQIFNSNSNNNICLGSHSWRAIYDIGIPESTTPGAPLLDQNRKVVGQIYCKAVSNDYPQYQNYTEAGKLSESWTGGNTNSSRLSNWLSPNSTLTSINSYRAMIIKGPSKITSSATYHVQNLPSGMSVYWTLSDSYYSQNCMQQNYSANWCTITRSSVQEMTNATLTAHIIHNGQNICNFTKLISTGNGFDGTYYNGQSTVPIDLPSPLYVLPGTLVTISSSYLVGASVVQNGGNATPTSWIFNSSSGVLKVGMPSSSGKSIIVRVTCVGGAIYNLPIMTTNELFPVMSLSMSGNLLEVAVTPSDTSKAFSSCNKEWTLRAYNSLTGEKMCEQKTSETSYSVNTSGWKPGVYLINAVVGDKVLSEKVIVK